MTTNPDPTAHFLLSDMVLVNVTNIVRHQTRTGIQRVLYALSQYWPERLPIVPFVQMGHGKIGIVSPEILQSIERYFEEPNNPVAEVHRAFHGEKLTINAGYFEIRTASKRVIREFSIDEALRNARAVLGLEFSIDSEFYGEVAGKFPEKLFHMCCDFILWLHPQHFTIDWRLHREVIEILSIWRKFENNFFISTATLNDYTKSINRGDKRQYTVIAPGVDGLGVRTRSTVPDTPEFVVVGTIEPRKQPIKLIEVFESLHRQGVDARLCFAGEMGWIKAEDRQRFMKAVDRNPKIRWVRAPSDIVLRELIGQARATIYVSQVEGFGSPPLESLSLGVPCIVSSTIPSVIDIAPGGQIRVAPEDSKALEAAIVKFLDKDFTARKQAEIPNVVLPTWKGFIEGIADLVERKAPLKSEGPVPTFQQRLAILNALDTLPSDPASAAVRLFGAVFSREPTKLEVNALLQESSADANKAFSVAMRFFARNPIKAATGDILRHAALKPEDAYSAFGLKSHAAPESAMWNLVRAMLEIPSNEAFAAACFGQFLLRRSEPDEHVWAEKLDGRTANRLQMIRAFLTCAEYLHVTGESADSRAVLEALPSLEKRVAVQGLLAVEDHGAFISAAFNDLLGRAPDQPGKANYLRMLKAGRTKHEVLLSILSSEEFVPKVGNPEEYAAILELLIARIPVEHLKDLGLAHLARTQPFSSLAFQLDALAHASPVEFLSKAYATILGRGPTSAERDAWIDGEAGGRTQMALIHELVVEAALQNRLSAGDDDLLRWSVEQVLRELDSIDNDRRFIAQGYAWILRRAPDANGQMNYLAALQNGRSRMACIAEWVSSAEFNDRIEGKEHANRAKEIIQNCLDAVGASNSKAA